MTSISLMYSGSLPVKTNSTQSLKRVNELPFPVFLDAIKNEGNLKLSSKESKRLDVKSTPGQASELVDQTGIREELDEALIDGRLIKENLSYIIDELLNQSLGSISFDLKEIVEGSDTHNSDLNEYIRNQINTNPQDLENLIHLMEQLNERRTEISNEQMVTHMKNHLLSDHPELYQYIQKNVQETDSQKLQSLIESPNQQLISVVKEVLSSDHPERLEKMISLLENSQNGKHANTKQHTHLSLQSILTQIIEQTENSVEGLEGQAKSYPQELVNLVDLIEQISAKPLSEQINRELVSEVKKALSLIDPELLDEKIAPVQNKEQNSPVVESKFTDLLTRSQAILSTVKNREDVIQVSPRVLELLQEWADLEKTENLSVIKAFTQNESEVEVDELKVWKELVKTFKNRSNFANNQGYSSEAEVTSKDVAKWLSQQLPNALNVPLDSQIQPMNTRIPISQLEQYVIHINDTDPAQSTDKQLIKQFQNIMKTGRLTMNNGFNQFTIALRPDNLGEMMVRLTQVDGEMTLKILVSSQSTKQMLEGNIRELRSMFSPHQVVIERQEASIGHVDQDESHESFNEDEGTQSNQSGKDENNDSDGEFDRQFKELLMNVKV